MDRIDLTLSDLALTTRVTKELEGLIITEEKARRMDKVFEAELEAGMKDGLNASSLQMENTYVPELLNGKEEGKFLALDLGGTNFRVILLEMISGKVVKEEIEYYSVQESTRLGPGTELFDFLASCIQDFVQKHSLGEQKLPLGFTFSFPMTQNALDSGILITWTKSFNCPGVVGTDAVAHLNDAIKRNGNLDGVKVVAVLNDTTGTLIKGSYDNPETCIGLILGTGCNGAYLEKAEKVLRWGGAKYDVNEVVVDPEFGAFGDNGCIDFIKTDFDRQLDQGSLLPGSFTFEKYFAGKYIGDLLRIILAKLHAEGLIFAGLKSDKLLTAGSIISACVSDVEEDTVAGGMGKTRRVISEALDLNQVTDDDVKIVQYVCALLTHRCAILVAIPLACFIRRMNKANAAIAVTGSLYKCHPRLKAELEKYIRMFSPNHKSETFLSDDGSGLGAGLVAAIATRLQH